MASNAVKLKKLMKALIINGVTLASMITSMRDDDKSTAPETISRWLTGSSPVDPGVLGWMTEKLRAKMRDENRSIVKWPENKSCVIAVSNYKGGVGKSTISLALATIAKRDYGIKVKHIQVGFLDTTCERYLETQHIDALYLSAAEAIKYTPLPRELVVLDVTYRCVLDESENFLSELSPDILLVPADFGSAAEAQGTRMFLDMIDFDGLTKLLHRPSFMDTDFSKIAAKSGFDVESPQFIPEFIPQSKNDLILPPDIFHGWTNEDQHWHYMNLFEYLFSEVGGDLDHSSEDSIKSFNIDELLELYTTTLTKKNNN